ncbi:MAG: hypothetical protein OQK82_01855 [Candidatus Pacearchaeota archaeon]|nr:hypothetical protein [Candidatus Pacearchaeota archaeon]
MPILKNKQERTFTCWIGDSYPEGGTIPPDKVVKIIAGESTPVSDEQMEKLSEIKMFQEAVEKEQIVIVGGKPEAISQDEKDIQIQTLKERLRQERVSKTEAIKAAAAAAREEAKAAEAKSKETDSKKSKARK